MTCPPERVITVALVELRLAMLADAAMSQRLTVAEALLIVAHALGADAGDCDALVNAINGGEIARITALADAVAGQIRAKGRDAKCEAECPSLR